MKTMAKEIGVLSVTKVGSNFTINTVDTSNGWESLGGSYFANRQYLDLAGMSLDEKTLFFQGAASQNVLPPATIPATAGNRAFVYDIMSNKPLSDTELGRIATLGNTSGTGLTFDQTIYMRIRILNMDLDNLAGGVMVTIFDEQLGSLEPTASDRVYCTRLV